MRAFAGRARAEGPGLAVSSPALHVQALKCAADGSGDLVLRLVELRGSRGTARVELVPDRTWGSIVETDLLERPTGDAEREGAGAVVTYRPYGIVTLRFGA